MLQELWQATQPVLLTALVSVVIILIRSAQKWIEAKISGTRHAAAAGIVMDSVLASVQKLGPEFVKMLQDGKLTPDEIEVLKDMARQIAKERLSELRGLAASRLGGWLETQLDISLGKLQARILGTDPQGDGLTIGPDDPAQ